MRNANVFPLPVTALECQQSIRNGGYINTSTTTSLLPMKRGIVDAWTGVILPKPIDVIASRIHSARGGVKASHALGSFFWLSMGAIANFVKFDAA